MTNATIMKATLTKNRKKIDLPEGVRGIFQRLAKQISPKDFIPLNAKEIADMKESAAVAKKQWASLESFYAIKVNINDAL
jgi:hypothetical protein